VHIQCHLLSIRVKAVQMTAVSRHCLLSENDRHPDCKSLTAVTLAVPLVRTCWFAWSTV